MIFILMGIATAFNFCIILWKFKKLRILDAILDLGLMSIISWMFSGTFSALSTGMIASVIVSGYLAFNPIKLSFRKRKKDMIF